jgi:diacylglycerol kinase (ATP)
VHLVVNPAAAGGRLGRQWSTLHQRLKTLGLDVPFSLTKAPGHATDLAAAVVSNGVSTVIAAGGDGTICEVVQGLSNAGRGALAVLPLGTGNDAARTLGVPLQLDRAAATVLAGSRRRVDLMRIGDRVALNAVGLGLLGAINVNAAAIKVVRGIAAYLTAAAVSLFRYSGCEVEICSDGFSYRGGMLILAVHNGPSTGGGFRLAPGAFPDDGVLDACLVENLPVRKRFHRLLTALRGTLGEQPGSHPFSFRRFELRTDIPIPAHLDGNLWQFDPPGLVFEVLPGALEVVAPSPPPRGRGSGVRGHKPS